MEEKLRRPLSLCLEEVYEGVMECVDGIFLLILLFFLIHICIIDSILLYNNIDMI